MHTFKTSITNYCIGFVLSICLTLAAYFVIVNQVTNPIQYIFGFAIIQLFVQLVFFLHLNTERSSRMQWLFLSFAGIVVVIVVGGSLWIMSNLNYNMTPDQMNASMLDQAE